MFAETIVNWYSLLTGFAAGAVVSTLFFSGLARGMRLALGSARPASILLLSASMRITMLLGAGYWLARASGDGWPVAGYALAFFMARLLAIHLVRPGSVTKEARPCS